MVEQQVPKLNFKRDDNYKKFLTQPLQITELTPYIQNFASLEENQMGKELIEAFCRLKVEDQ